MSNDRLAQDMIQILGEDRVLFKDLDLKYYSFDSSFYTKLKPVEPNAVCFPTSTEEVQKIMIYAKEHKLNVTPRGAGSAETGGPVAVEGGIILDFSMWDTIEEVDTADMQVIVRPGIVHAELNEQLAKYGLFFPPDPGSSKMCTLGGMIANNSSGLRAVKYGTTENYILGLEVVTADGDVITTGGMKAKCIKNVSGINLTKLMIGSEGILGIVTKIRLRVWPKPRARGICMAVFDHLDDAPATVLDVYQYGILPSGIEILDHSAIKALNEYNPALALPTAEAILLFEVDGNPPSVEWEGEHIKEICEKRARTVEWTHDPVRMGQLWEGRSVIASAAARIRADGTRAFAGEDISVPLSRVTEFLRRTHALAKECDIPVVTYGHIGDGNVHSAPIINPEIPEEVEKVLDFVHKIHLMAIELNGSTTGEHGVGVVRKQYAEMEHGIALKYMRRVKDAFDPEHRMNPGKVF